MLSLTQYPAPFCSVPQTVAQFRCHILRLTPISSLHVTSVPSPGSWPLPSPTPPLFPLCRALNDEGAAFSAPWLTPFESVFDPVSTAVSPSPPPPLPTRTADIETSCHQSILAQCLWEFNGAEVVSKMALDAAGQLVQPALVIGARRLPEGW